MLDIYFLKLQLSICFPIFKAPKTSRSRFLWLGLLYICLVYLPWSQALGVRNSSSECKLLWNHCITVAV